jgi:hypothetical protein
MREYLVFGDDGAALYVQNLMSGKYEVILRVSLTVLEKLIGSP